MFTLESHWPPGGDQPQAIKELSAGLELGDRHQTLLGVTGSGKTFTMANVLAKVQRPAIVLAPNKTLAGQLYEEFKGFFPHNAVEYFVSYYDYYQPEAYVPSSDTYIEKDSAINEKIEQLRLSATKALLERKDVIVVASVSAIYGLGDPDSYRQMVLPLTTGDVITPREAIEKLTSLQYARNDVDLKRGTFRVHGDLIDIFPAENSEQALRVEFFDDRVESLALIDPLTGHTVEKIKTYKVFPKTHYAAPKEQMKLAVTRIKAELADQLQAFKHANKLLELQRLEQRTHFDLEMIEEIGYCKGIENYSRHLSNRLAGEPPPCLFDYLPNSGIIVIDESHVTVPQLGAMYKGDRSRKQTLVDYGFRLPSALDNRPLKFEEFEERAKQLIYVSATPGKYELERSTRIVEQVVRPTGLVDPQVIVRPAKTQVDDVLSEIKLRVDKNERVLITTLTKRMSEDLTDYLGENQIKAKYLHSDIETLERAQLIHDLRAGEFDVLVGINLLREGLDMPEVSLVAIMDADKEGFLRSSHSLIQTIGRAARNLNGQAILYADRITGSMKEAMDETDRRRKKQERFNKKNHITPRGIDKMLNPSLGEILDGAEEIAASVESSQKTHKKSLIPQLPDLAGLSEHALQKLLKEQEKAMKKHAQNLEFEKAAAYRNQIKTLQAMMIGSMSLAA